MLVRLDSTWIAGPYFLESMILIQAAFLDSVIRKTTAVCELYRKATLLPTAANM
jgi:hypothetical protein